MGGDQRDSLTKELFRLPPGWRWEWFTDVMDVKGGTQPPASEFIDHPKEGYVRLVQIRDFDTDEHKTYIPDSKKWRKCKTDDVLIARYGAALGRICKGLEGAYNVALAKVDNKKLHKQFIFYLLKSKYFQGPLLASGARSAQSGFNKQTLSVITLPIPPLEEQRAIAHILGTLDDKIELNRQMNRTLEAMAQALFKSFFLDFDPVVVNALRAGNPIPEKFAQRAAHYRGNPDALRLPEETLRQFPDRFQDSELGPIPEGWEVGILADLAELNSDSWNQKTLPDEILYVDLSNTKFGIIESVKTFNKQDAPSRARRILKPGDTIIGVVRPANKSYAMIGETPNILTGSTGFAVLSPKSAVFREYVYLQATNEENITRLARLADGAAYPAVRPNVVADTKCVISDEQVLKLFHEATVALYDKFHKNNSESETLSTLRDTLLPKLISGELRVPDAEKVVEDVL